MRRITGFTRRVVDPVNSAAWYAMDGLWLAQLAWPAYVATAATLSTGALLLLLRGGRAQRVKDDLALNAWMWMNALWLISDLGARPVLRHVALVVGGLGAVLLANAVRPSNSHREVLSRLRKLRVSGR